MMRRLRLALIAALASVGLVLTGGVASADVCASCNGGLIVNQTYSDTAIILFNGSSTLALKPGNVSEWWTYFRDVDQIYLPGCKGRYYVGNTYKGTFGANTWIHIGDSAAYSVRVDC